MPIACMLMPTASTFSHVNSIFENDNSIVSLVYKIYLFFFYKIDIHFEMHTNRYVDIHLVKDHLMKM